MEKPAIAVVGAGLVGAAAALSLSRRFAEHQIHWLDRGSMEPAPTAPHIESRVIACTPGSQNYLQSLGLWDKLDAERLQNYQAMRVWDQTSGAEIEFEASDLDASHLGVILEVSELSRAIFQQSTQQANLRLWPQSEVVDLGEVENQRRILALSSGESLSCSLVIGADGSRSTIRELAGIRTRVRAMEQIATVAVVTHQYTNRNTAWQAFGESGPLAFLPLPDTRDGKHQSAIVWSVDDAKAKIIAELKDEDLLTLLESAIDGRLGSIDSLRQRAAFPLSQLHAQQYVLPGLCLLGDAVHTLHPLAGQGANLGFRDVATLNAELERARHRQVWIGDSSILRRYERSRKLENLAMLASMEALRHGFGSRHSVLRWAFSSGMKQVNKWGFIKGYLARQAMH